MSNTCESWLGLVNFCIYHTYQTREICQVQHYSVNFKVPGSFEMHWARQFLVDVVLFRKKGPVNIWNDHEVQTFILRRTSKHFHNSWHCFYVDYIRQMALYKFHLSAFPNVEKLRALKYMVMFLNTMHFIPGWNTYNIHRVYHSKNRAFTQLFEQYFIYT